MATPPESTTKVNGRRCTRSRARTAATSSLTTQEPAVVTPTEVTSSTPAAQAPQIQTSAAASSAPPSLPPLPPPPPASSSSASAEPPPAAATTSASSSATGTSSAAPSPSPHTRPLADVAPLAVAQPGPKDPADVPPQVAVATPATPAAAVTSSSTTSSTPSSAAPSLATTSSATASPERSSPNTNVVAAPSLSLVQSSLSTPPFTAPAESNALPTSPQAAPEQPNSTILPEASSATTPGVIQPLPTRTPASPNSGVGIIAPDQGTGPDNGLTIPSSGDANIGAIVGGVVGGVAGLALLCTLLFMCLRKRKSEPRWDEKRLQGPGFVEKLKAKSVGLGVFIAKAKGERAGPSRNLYQRHSQQDSISSIYSTPSDGRPRSFSEPQEGLFAVGIPARRSSSRKSERNLLRKKNSSVSSQSAFVGIVEENNADPFADPDPPRTLLLLNPDAASPRGPTTPQPVAASAGMPRNPFATPFDDVEQGSAVPGHKRTASSSSALSSHPPQFFFPSADLAFKRKPVAPPPPTQPPISTQRRRSSLADPSFNAMSTFASEESGYTVFGNSGPSRPNTNLFTPALPTGRTVRQSDPFDLDRPEVLRFTDRPEVLGYGNVAGRREVRQSVTRQATRGKRTSSVGNWGSATDSPYAAVERYSGAQPRAAR